MAATRQIEVRDSAASSVQAMDELQDVQGEKMTLNMGPSHPATHGVLPRARMSHGPSAAVAATAASGRRPRLRLLARPASLSPPVAHAALASRAIAAAALRTTRVQLNDGL